MRTQRVYYAVLEVRVKSDVWTGCGYTDWARFILHVGNRAILFGHHDGRTWVVEILTSGFIFRCRLLRTGGPRFVKF
jgi:hypothetical protein